MQPRLHGKLIPFRKELFMVDVIKKVYPSQQKYPTPCPLCGKVRLVRVDRLGNNCLSCGHKKTRINGYHGEPLTTSEYDKRYVERHCNDVTYRIRRLLKGIKARAKREGIAFDIDYEYMMSIYPDDSICPILGTKMTFDSGDVGYTHRGNGPSVNRIIPEKGYTKGNVAWVSHKANILKGSLTIENAKRFLAYMEKHDDSKCDT